MMILGGGRKVLNRAVNQIGPAFDPLSLSPIYLYDYTDWSAQFQDVTAITPVTAAGQPIERLNDKATAHIAIQATSASAPVSAIDAAGKKCAYYNGVGQYLLATATSQPAASGALVTTFLAVRHALPPPTATSGLLIKFNSASVAGQIGFNIQAGGDGNCYHTIIGGQVCQGFEADTENATLILTQRFDMTAGITAAQALQVRVNGVNQTLTYSPNQPPNGVGQNVQFSAQDLYLGGSAAVAGTPNYQYLAIAYNGALSDAQCKQVEDWINARVGAY